MTRNCLIAVLILFGFSSNAQFTIDVQKVQCNTDSSNVRIYAINQTDSSNVDLPIWSSLYALIEGGSYDEILNLGDTLTLHKGWFFFDSYKNSLRSIENEFSNRFGGPITFYKFDSGCTYAIHVHYDKKVSNFWYVGQKFDLPIYFELDSDKLRPDAKVVLDDLVKTLMKSPELNIEIGQHFDERRSKMISTCLSCSRAEEIRKYLINRGISEAKLTAKGYEGTKPKIKNANSEEEHQQNRRTEITITSVGN